MFDIPSFFVSSLGRQTMHCWSDPKDYSESSLVLESNAPDLRLYNFDNMINYCCFNGVWILYNDYNYNSDKYKVPD